MDEQLTVWGGAWRASTSRGEIPTDTSATDERRMQLVNVYTMMNRKEVK